MTREEERKKERRVKKEEGRKKRKEIKRRGRRPRRERVKSIRPTHTDTPSKQHIRPKHKRAHMKKRTELNWTKMNG